MAEPRRIGKYEILEELGRGGFAVVYRARDAQMGREVALKVVPSPGAQQEHEFVERFQQEARVAAGLRHPNIVPVYDFGEADGVLYLAMALIGQGRTLRDLLAEQGALPLEQALPILAQLAGALDYLHQHEPPLVHRDVKPANLLLEQRGEGLWAVLTDFGLVRSLQASTGLTRSGTTLGTPAYMAPEQADPDRWGEVTSLTDVYALGVVAYEMLVGRPPFVGKLATVLHAHAYVEPPSPLEAVPGLGDDLSALLLRALAKPPAGRYPTARAFVAALRDLTQARVAAAGQEATLKQLEVQARKSLESGKWLEALNHCVQMIRLAPDHPTAQKMLDTAKEGLDRERAETTVRRRLEERYSDGLQLLDAEKWKEAIAALEEVERANPDFRDVQAKLVQARDELQRAQWYDEAIAHGEAKRWAEACRLWLRVLRGGMDYRDGDAAGRLLEAVEGVIEQLETASAVKAVLQARVAELEARLQEAGAAPPARQKPARSRARAKTERPAAPAGDRWRNPKDGKEMVRVPAGKFLYGDDKKEVELPEFWIDRAPVTNGEYSRFVAETGREAPEHWNGKTPPKKIADHPVTHVSWDDVTAYAGWAGGRLPTEEEWEKAARGTNGREYPWGKWAEGRCNSQEAGIGGTTPVGQYSPQGDSPYGCQDCAGNVWEWTASEHEQGRRGVRGGSFHHDRSYARCACRYRNYPDYEWNNNGFRLVASRAPG
jgi:serine/threonine protein kinase/formylglycine-generating enzyme required for sulfatase activity